MPGLLLAVVLLGAPAAATEKIDAVALIGGGGAAASDAQDFLDDWRRDDDVWLSSWLRFPAGVPRAVDSGSIEDLKPGFHVALLGVCKPEQARLVLPLLKAVSAQIYSREVRVRPGELACPEITNDKPFPADGGQLPEELPSSASLGVHGELNLWSWSSLSTRRIIATVSSAGGGYAALWTPPAQSPLPSRGAFPCSSELSRALPKGFEVVQTCCRLADCQTCSAETYLVELRAGQITAKRLSVKQTVGSYCPE